MQISIRARQTHTRTHTEFLYYTTSTAQRSMISNSYGISERSASVHHHEQKESFADGKVWIWKDQYEVNLPLQCVKIAFSLAGRSYLLTTQQGIQGDLGLQLMLSTVMSGVIFCRLFNSYQFSHRFFSIFFIYSQASWQPGAQPLGLWRSGSFHGELLCITEGQYLQKC